MKPRICVLFILWLLGLQVDCLLSSASAQTWLWGRKNTGSGVDAYAVAADNAGNVYAGGYNFDYLPAVFGGLVLPNTSPAGGQQALWVKYSSNGTPIWADGGQEGSSYLYNLATDPSGNLIVFGSFSTPHIKIGGVTLSNLYGTAGKSQFFIAKYSPSGTLLWARADGCTSATDHYFLGIWILSTGGVTTDSAGNIYITSSFREQHITIGSYMLNNADPSGATNDAFVAKYSPSGALLWAQRSGGESDDFAYGIAVGQAGKVYITGPFWSHAYSFGSSVIGNPYATSGYGPASKPIAYIAEFSAAGDPLWAQAPGGNLGAYGIGVVSDKEGNIYMTGGFCNESITFDTVAAIRAFAGGVPNLALYLVRYSPAHDVTWSKTISSPSQGVWGFSIGLACGEVWVSGNYKQDADVDGHNLQVVPGPDPVFIAGYNLAGGVVGYSGLGSGGDDQNGIAVDPVGNVFICSDFENVSQFIIGPDTLLDVPSGSSTDEFLYVGKYANPGPTADTIRMHTDTTVCQMSGLTLFAPSAYGNYYWSDGGTDTIRTVGASGTLWVMCTKTCTPILVDTFHITMMPADTTHSTVDVAVCSGDAAVIKGEPGFTTYGWSTGSTDSGILVSAAGTYWLTEINGCSMGRDTFNVSLLPLPAAHIGNDTFFCHGHNLVLHAPTQADVTYLWSTGSTDSSISISDSGSYYLSVNKNGCVVTDTINIRLISGPAPFFLGADTTICRDDPYVLSAGNYQARWSTGNVGTAIAVEQAGTYFATIDNACGVVSDSIHIDFIDCNIWLPNAFTPNGSGKNDIFRVRGVLNYFTNFSMSIFNRFGQCVYFSEDRYSGWNGTFNNIPQDLGTYFYEVKYELNGKRRLLKGDVTLVR